MISPAVVFAGSNSQGSPVAIRGAIDTLAESYSQLLQWFDDYDSAGSNLRKQELASRICRGMQAHMSLEQELFVPEFLEAVNDRVAGEAVPAEQAILSQLTERVLESSPIDEMFDSKVRILGDAFALRVAVETQYFM
ncbi:MAG TPA: hypothetical protein VHW95_10010 [Steroidobacteraceae bacterium]|jgi:hypothetical protein|nr:hypothetical protein [Steroidobacteraceae bacterium]